MGIKLIKLEINNQRMNASFIGRPVSERECCKTNRKEESHQQSSGVAGAWADIQSPVMDARRMNKVTRPAFGGSCQFYSTTSHVNARRFETFLGLDTSSIRQDDRKAKNRSRSSLSD